MENKVKSFPTIHTAKNNVFFQDFLTFLRLFEKRPLGLTKTGNLQIKEIETLGKLFRHDIYSRDKKGKIMFRTRTENNFRYLLRIRQIASVMYLVYKRKGRAYLSKNGKGYLNNIKEKTQYEQMILWYFHRANWAYLHPYEEVIEILQDNQRNIWLYFVRQEKKWLDFKKFARRLVDYFGLSVKDIYGNKLENSAFWAIENVLVKDLKQLGLMKVKKKKDKYGFDNVAAFKPTETGIHIFKKALEPF